MKISQERATVQAMISLYCHKHHKSQQLCEECSLIWEYTDERLEKCPFGVEKPTCQNCQIHCYKPEMRQKIKEIMRYAGPRMLFHHPIMAIRHLYHNKKSG
ncbi:MAG: nitrous oxide-stimulated promoter family protein [Chloroflexi bacterium]|nr:nitrous oxide-stimulated promoter family protein [Chloroflexota bacterium]